MVYFTIGVSTPYRHSSTGPRDQGDNGSDHSHREAADEWNLLSAVVTLHPAADSVVDSPPTAPSATTFRTLRLKPHE